MQSWENGLHVSKGKNVERFIEALAREGVFCTSEWLIEGVGDPAKPLLGSNNVIKTAARLMLKPEQGPPPQLKQILDQLIQIHSNLGESLLSFKVPDDTMAPKFLMGDFVLGRLVKDHEKESIHQKYCLIELNPDRFIVRKVIYTKDSLILLALDERFKSIGLNLSSQVYLIVWHWMNQ